MQRFQHLKHSWNIAVRKVMFGSLFQAIIPDLMPQNRRSNELGTDERRLEAHQPRVCAFWLRIRLT